jgi:hypothetical protein
MKSIVKLAAPVALAFAAFGAQAAELAPGDFGVRNATGVTVAAEAPRIAAPATEIYSVGA